MGYDYKDERSDAEKVAAELNDARERLSRLKACMGVIHEGMERKGKYMYRTSVALGTAWWEYFDVPPDVLKPYLQAAITQQEARVATLRCQLKNLADRD